MSRMPLLTVADCYARAEAIYRSGPPALLNPERRVTTKKKEPSGTWIGRVGKTARDRENGVLIRYAQNKYRRQVENKARAKSDDRRGRNG